MSATIIKGGRVIDPANGRDETGDVVIVDGKIADQSAIRDPKSHLRPLLLADNVPTLWRNIKLRGCPVTELGTMSWRLRASFWIG